MSSRPTSNEPARDRLVNVIREARDAEKDTWNPRLPIGRTDHATLTKFLETDPEMMQAYEALSMEMRARFVKTLTALDGGLIAKAEPLLPIMGLIDLRGACAYYANMVAANRHDRTMRGSWSSERSITNPSTSAPVDTTVGDFYESLFDVLPSIHYAIKRGNHSGRSSNEGRSLEDHLSPIAADFTALTQTAAAEAKNDPDGWYGSEPVNERMSQLSAAVRDLDDSWLGK